METFRQPSVDGADVLLAQLLESPGALLVAPFPLGRPIRRRLAGSLLVGAAHPVGELRRSGGEVFLAHVRTKRWDIDIHAELVEDRGHP
jgi:hypothetical protein